jgi:hypothetical protein
MAIADEKSVRQVRVLARGELVQEANNWSDALLIASVRGFTTFYVRGDSTVDGSNDFDNMEIIGESPNKSTLTIHTLSQTTGLELKNATVTGTLDGNNFIEDCTVEDLEYFNGVVEHCGLIGDITLGGTADVAMVNCYTVDQDDPPSIDMGGTGCSLAMPNYSGLLSLKNLSDSNQEIGVGFNAGFAVLDSTITAGTIIISGIGGITDNSGGTASVDTTTLISNTSIVSAIMAEDIDTGVDVQAALKTIIAALAGKASGGGTATIAFRDQADSKDVLTMTVDSNGNRTNVTFDAD